MPRTASHPDPAAADAPPAWAAPDLDRPHAQPDKARRVEQMFAAIAPSYDLNNRVHSLGRDQAWRRAAVRAADIQPGDRVLDVACGTGDLSLAFQDTAAAHVVGIDFTVPMLAVANQKDPGPERPTYYAGDALRLPVADASVDVVSIAFGIRNVADPAAALAEFARVLRPGGRLIVLEFTVPPNPLVRWGNAFYSGWLMPRTASWIARDRSGAYRYLPRSINTFASKDQLLRLMADHQFTGVSARSLTLGIAAIYRGLKPGTGSAP
ncbi:MAG: bifunctional demethylmenaquinone methyltransferase/2-methoxy-6-polyprenyl-1,4-benzoquinol methylase UbiE [Planctomycetota bacterium]